MTTPKSRRRRWLLLLLILPVAAVALTWGFALWHGWRGRVTLDEAIAEADRLDPGWRAAELHAKRAELPDETNSAVLIMALTTPPQPLADDVGDLKAIAPNVLLPQAVRDTIEQALRNTFARKRTDWRDKLAALPDGRFPFDATRPLMAALTESQRAGQVLGVLRLDVYASYEGAAAAGALPAWRAALNAARSPGDEPLIISQMPRTNGRVTVAGLLERLLGQAEWSDADLASAQRALEDEDAAQVLLVAMRGERASGYQVLEAGRAAAATKSTLTHWSHAASAAWDGRLSVAEALAMLPENLPTQQAAALRYQTKLVEMAKRPPEEWPPVAKALGSEAATLPALARLMAPAILKTVPNVQRGHAHLRVAIIAVAAERFRLKSGRWPRTSAELVEAGLLMTVPPDPRDGKPFALSPTPDGLLVGTTGNAADAGFRLYNPRKRGLPGPDAP